MPIVVDVSGSWESDALCTRTDLKRFLHLEDPTAVHADDTLCDYLIAGCSNLFEKEVQRVITQTAYSDERHSGMDGHRNSLRVKYPPIASSPTPQLWDDTDYDFNDEDEFTLNDEWQYDANSGLIWLLNTTFTKGRNNIKVSYTGGFETIPDAIQQAVCFMSAFCYRQILKQNYQLSSENFGEFATTYITEPWPSWVDRTIARYRRRHYPA